MTEEIGVGRVYLRHAKRLHEITQRHGRQMMMWADMFWHYPELVPEFPDDIVLLDWWYEPKEHFETVDVLAKTNRRFYVCPGTSSWSSLFPRLENAIANVQVFVRDGVAAGAEGMLMTDWGDYGHYQLLSHSWYPYLWAAECAWTGGATPVDGFDAAFDRLFLADGSGTVTAALRRLGAAMAVDPSWMVTWNSAMALFEDPLAGHLATTVDPAVVAEARAAAGALLPLLDRVRDAGIRHDLGYTAAQIRFAADKIDLSRAIRHVLRDIARETAPTDAGRARLDELIGLLRRQRDALPALIAEFEIRWLAHARRSEVAVNLDRFARLLARHDAALTWLDTQRTAYQAGRGIDGALATYEVGDYGVIWQESLANVNRLAEIVGEEAIPPDIRRWRAALLNPPTEEASIAAEPAPTSK
jgi:hypothetical protein